MMEETHAAPALETQDAPSDEAIRQRSQEIWEREGRPEGLALDHWLRARAELEAERTPALPPTPPQSDPAPQTPAAVCETLDAQPVETPALPCTVTGTLPVRKRPAIIDPANRQTQDVAALSIVSAGVVFSGAVESSGDVHIEGRVDGTITCTGLVVGDDAVVIGDIVANDVTVRGRVLGSIDAGTIHLGNGSYVEGTVIYGELSIEEGAELNGEFRYAGAIDALAEAFEAELKDGVPEPQAAPETPRISVVAA